MNEQLLDAIAQANFPVLVAKHAQPIEPAAVFGQRYIVGKHGLYREVTTPWLLTRTPIAMTEGIPTPYGEVNKVAILKCGSPPASLWSAFIEHARKECPIECAGLMIWNAQTHEWRLAIRDVAYATSSQVDYMEPTLGEDEVAVVDVHSHGRHGAFFSKRDDADDLGCIKVSAVIGGVDKQTPQVMIRLVCIDSIHNVTMSRGELTVVLEDAR